MLSANTHPPIGKDLAHAMALLRNGALVAFPSETVYGLGANALNPLAVAKVFQAKGRPSDHPLIVHLPSAEALTHWAREIPATAWTLAHAFWPGPLTLVLPKTDRVPEVVTGGQDTVALRVPKHPLTLALLQALGPDQGLVGPSANRYQRISPTNPQAVIQELGAAVAHVLDGGSCQVGIESTIVSCDPDGRSVQILRQGMLGQEALAKVLGPQVAIRLNIDHAEAQKLPGSDRLHYAPQKPVYLGNATQILAAVASIADANLSEANIFNADISDTGISGAGIPDKQLMSVWSFQAAPSHLPQQISWQQYDIADPANYAKGLYQGLRAFDASQATALWIEAPPAIAPWSAIADRLGRASKSITQ